MLDECISKNICSKYVHKNIIKISNTRNKTTLHRQEIEQNMVVKNVAIPTEIYQRR